MYVCFVLLLFEFSLAYFFILLTFFLLSQEEIQRKINSGDSAQLQLSSTKLDVANESYNYVVARHKEVLKLERSLQEVHQLFVDMAALVDQQGEVIDRIAFRIAFAKEEVALVNWILPKKKRTCVVQ